MVKPRPKRYNVLLLGSTPSKDPKLDALPFAIPMGKSLTRSQSYKLRAKLSRKQKDYVALESVKYPI